MERMDDHIREQVRAVNQNDRRKQGDRRKNERRMSKRIYKKITTRFRFLNENNSEKWDIIFIENIGVGGVLFKFDRPLEVGTMIELKVSFPGDLESISCQAKISRVEKVGVSRVNEVVANFVGLSSKNAEHINQFSEKINTSSN